MKARVLLPVCAILLGLCSATLALVVEVPVTPEYLKRQPRAFSIEAKRGKGGLIALTISRQLDKPQYLIARFTVRKGRDIVAESHSPGVRQGDSKYYLSILPEFVADSEFELDECAFTQDHGQDILFPGGTHYRLRLKDFISAELLKAAPASEVK
jgi:hypothetical protein